MGNIIWLASYPKSGNTWFRTFISQLRADNSEEVSINQLQTDGIFSSRVLLDSIAGVESADLTLQEIDRLRPVAYNYLAQTTADTLFIKVHDAYTYLEDGAPLLGTTRAKGVYIIRNPLDIAVSLANHCATDIRTAINNMSDVNFAFCGSQARLPNQLRQKLLSWSLHAESWAQAKEIPVHWIRYEDMKREPLDTFTQAVRFMELDYTREQIQQAIALSDFKRLQEQERTHGFREKPYQAMAFFRAGEAGDWKNHLTEEQIHQVVSDHKDAMKQFGYLDQADQPV